MAKTLKKRTNKAEVIFYCCILAWPILQFSVFYIGVNVNSILLAFKSIDPNTGVFSYIGLDNFKTLFYDIANTPYYRYAFKNSFVAYGIGLIVGMPIGLFFSYYIFKKMPLSGFFKTMLFVPSIISSIIIVTVFTHFVENVIPDVMQKVFKIKVLGLLNNPDTTFGTILFYCCWIGFGTSTLLYVGAMNNINESSLEAAKLDGVNALQEFFRIVLPQIFSTLTVFLTAGIAGIFTNQLNLFSFYGAGAEHQLYTIGYILYMRVQSASNASVYPYLSALGLCITVIVAPLTLVLRGVLNRIDPMRG